VVLVATGSRPFHPPGIPFDDALVADSETILAIGELPRRFLVVGGGAVGCEYASIFTALGAEVTLLELTDRLLPFMDGEMSRLLADIFRGQGMDVRLGTALRSVARAGTALDVAVGDGERLVVDRMLFAGGRLGNTENLGLEDAGVKLDARGRIIVDAAFQTTAPGVYAAGDVIGPPALASVSMEQGRVAACHAFDSHFKEAVDPLPPYGVYAMPEVAMVGLTEEQARERGIDYEVGRRPFEKSGRARIAGATDGVLKLLFRRSDRVLLGVHAVADIASELIHLGQLVVRLGLPIDHFIHTTFNVPTYSEAYKYAAYDGLQRLAASPSPTR
jgi:NAD(P) transhydrogenase